MGGLEPAESLRGRRKRVRRASRCAPAEAGEERMHMLLLVELAGPTVIMADISAGSRRFYKPCS